MFIEQAVQPQNQFWKYIVGSAIVILASFIGQIPLTVAVLSESFQNGQMPTSNSEVMAMLDSNLMLFLMLLTFAAALPAFFLVVKKLHAQSILSVTTSRSKVDLQRVFFAFSLWAGITIAATGIDYLLSPEDYVWNFKPIPFFILLAIGIVMIPLQTSMEEYIFRGYMMQGFGNLSHNRWFPLLMTSVIFGLMHIFNPEVGKIGYIIMFYYIGTGLFLGIITLMDEGMELALGFHAANNLVGALLVTTDWTAFQTNSLLKDISEPVALTDVLLPLLIIYPIVLIIFKMRYGWRDWAVKLTQKFDRHGNPISQTNAGESQLQ